MFSGKIKAPAATARQKPVLFSGCRIRRHHAPGKLTAFPEKK